MPEFIVEATAAYQYEADTAGNATDRRFNKIACRQHCWQRRRDVTLPGIELADRLSSKHGCRQADRICQVHFGVSAETIAYASVL